MTDVEKSRLDKLKDELKGLMTDFVQLQQRFGLVGAISIIVCLGLAATVALAWWNWEDLKKRPGMEWVVLYVGKTTSPPTAEQTIADEKLALAERARLSGHNDEARAAYGEALTLYKKEDHLRGQANVQRALGELERLADRNDEARAAFGKALALYKQIDDRRGQAEVQCGLGNLERMLGRYDQARAAYSDALTLYKQIDNRLGQANVQSGLGNLESALGRNEEARATYSDALTL